jgi:splicing factor U2AF 35 kDa subunit
MADRLSRIYGTEEDKVNCPFYFKIGACRHGDRCTRLHNKPLCSQTILMPHMYENPAVGLAMFEGTKVPEKAIREAIRHFEDFFEEVWLELSNYGELLELSVCDNMGDHLIGNVYAKFSSEEEAELAARSLNGRYYAGRVISTEFSPVTDFKEARCRQYDEGNCDRGGYCNFMHLKHISRSFKKSLQHQMYYEHPEYKQKRIVRLKQEAKNRKQLENHPVKKPSPEYKRQSSAERRAMIESWNRKEGR